VSAQRQVTKAETIEEVVAYLREKLPDEDIPLAEAFAREYYDGIAPEDLRERSVLDLYGSALSAFGFAIDRKDDEFKVRVFSPRL
jgi:glutamate dehydrogenase